MKALRANSPTAEFQIESVPVPALAPDDVLIKVAVAGINPGVVKMTRFGKAHVPCTLGHEAAGTIERVGENVKDVPLGSRVRLHPTLNCRQCSSCTRGEENLCDEAALMGFARFGRHSELYDRYHDGTIAEYVRAPWWLVDRLPDNTSLEVGAKVHDVATALRALKIADMTQDSTVVLTAATGAMGTLTLKLARFFPIKRIILVGRSEARMTQICTLSPVPTELVVTGGDEAGAGVAQPHMQSLAPRLLALAPEGIDVIIDYMPSGDLLPRVLPALRTGGTLVHMGGNPKPLPIPMAHIMNNCWKVTGGRANTREDVKQVLDWLGQGKLEVDDLITHRFEFSQVHKMLELLENRSEPVWLSVLRVDVNI